MGRKRKKKLERVRGRQIMYGIGGYCKDSGFYFQCDRKLCVGLSSGALRFDLHFNSSLAALWRMDYDWRIGQTRVEIRIPV